MSSLTRLGTALVLGLGLLLTIDPVSAGVALAFEGLVFLFASRSGRGLFNSPGELWSPLTAQGSMGEATPESDTGMLRLRLWPRVLFLTVGALLAGVTISLYGATSGTTVWHAGVITISTGSLHLALATALRVLAVGLPGVVLLAGIDATELGDGLAQGVHLPARFVLGTVAALRLVSLVTDDWRSVELGRRARGAADHGRLRRLPGQVFAVLVLAIRRGSKLATAMEARGFGTGPRSWARPVRFRTEDGIAWCITVGILAVSLGSAILSGSWHWIVS